MTTTLRINRYQAGHAATFNRVSFQQFGEESIPWQGNSKEKLPDCQDILLDSAAKKEYLKPAGHDISKENVKDQNASLWRREVRDNFDSVRVKRFKVFYISREVGRIIVRTKSVTR